MYKIIPFEDIEKNKWNGTVHYALNGNPFGYHWYLKAVIGEWRAAIENDYESAMPLFNDKMAPHQYELLRELGPYSVNPLTDQRANDFIDYLKTMNKSARFPLSGFLKDVSLSDHNIKSMYKAVFAGGRKYEDVYSSYSDALKHDLTEKGYDDIQVVSSIKPEEFVANLEVSDPYKNALMRIMYNAQYRGLGFSSGIKDAKTGKMKAQAYFLTSHESITELICMESAEKKYHQLIYDLILRGNAQRLITIQSYSRPHDLVEMGFDLEPYYQIQLDSSIKSNLLKVFGQAH